MDRRKILYGAGAIGALSLTVAATSCSTTLNADAIAKDIAAVCGILVPISTVATAINAAVGATAQMVVDLFCTGLHNAAGGGMSAVSPSPPKSGSTVDFVVVVNGTKIPVHATYK